MRRLTQREEFVERQRNRCVRRHLARERSEKRARGRRAALGL